MAKQVSPKQRALIEYLGLPVPSNGWEASNLIEAATNDERYRIRLDDWQHARHELHPQLYPPLPPEIREEQHAEWKRNRAPRLRAALINDVPEQLIDIKKKITIGQSEKAVLWLDCNHPGWDRQLDGDYNFLNLDTFCKYYAPAVAATSPELLKKGRAVTTKKPSRLLKLIFVILILAVLGVMLKKPASKTPEAPSLRGR